LATNNLTFATLCSGVCEPYMIVLLVFLNALISFKMHATVTTPLEGFRWTRMDWN